MKTRGIPESPQERDSVANAVAGDEQPPDPAARESMAALGVSYVGGLYCFESFRYDRPADAMHYALTPTALTRKGDSSSFAARGMHRGYNCAQPCSERPQLGFARQFRS